MNPAVIVIDVEQENLKISAYAKEGLVSQHTAEKAIDKLLNALWQNKAAKTWTSRGGKPIHALTRNAERLKFPSAAESVDSL